MNLKKTLAGIAAGAMAISTVAAVAVSAQDAKTTTFDTFDVAYYTTVTITAKAALATDNALVTVDFSDITAGTGISADDVTIDSASLNGTAVAKDDLDVVVKKPTASTVTVNGLGVDAGKVVNVKFSVKMANDKGGVRLNKDRAKDFAEDIKDSNEIVATAGAATKNFFVTVDGVNPAGSIAAKATSEENYLQIAGKTTTGSDFNVFYANGQLNWLGKNPVANIDDEQWDTVAAQNANLDTAIANELAANRGAKLTFYFQDKMENEDDGLASAPDYSQDTGWSDGATEDFAIRVNGTKSLTGIGIVDADALTITFDWDTVLSKSNLTNAVGQVNNIEFKANEDGFLYNGDYDDDKDEATYRYEITKIVVSVPEMDVEADDMSNLAAGEAETTVEATLPAGDAPAAETTAAAANPTTGNSAVALVAIPVAIAAAAFVAKKRG